MFYIIVPFNNFMSNCIVIGNSVSNSRMNLIRMRTRVFIYQWGNRPVDMFGYSHAMINMR